MLVKSGHSFSQISIESIVYCKSSKIGDSNKKNFKNLNYKNLRQKPIRSKITMHTMVK